MSVRQGSTNDNVTRNQANRDNDRSYQFVVSGKWIRLGYLCGKFSLFDLNSFLFLVISIFFHEYLKKSVVLSVLI